MIRPMVWILFVVLLPLGCVSAGPAEVLPTLCALHLRAASANQLNPGTALSVGATFGAMLNEKLGKPYLNHFVRLIDLLSHICVFSKQVNSVNEAPLEWVDVLLAV